MAHELHLDWALGQPPVQLDFFLADNFKKYALHLHILCCLQNFNVVYLWICVSCSLPGRYEAFWKELDSAKLVWKNRNNLKVEDAGVAALFGIELYAWSCLGEIVGRGFTLTGYHVWSLTSSMNNHISPHLPTNTVSVVSFTLTWILWCKVLVFSNTLEPWCRRTTLISVEREMMS